MMDWTDRHCRFFHRQLSRHALLYTEMLTAAALVRGNAARLLEQDPATMPVAVQLGGADPAELAAAARIAADAGFREINLNVGCPSDRVQSGCFGAVLMREPALVAACVAAMADASGREVTVKCRIGVDEQDPRDSLPRFLETVSAGGVSHFIIHARKAWLQGLSPKENRDVPPLDHALVLEMKRAFPQLRITLNGGINTIEEAAALLSDGYDGVMVGRAAYHRPADILGHADRLFSGAAEPTDPVAAARAMIPYIERHMAAGGSAHDVTRHMLGLFTGRRGARAWRRHLSIEAVRDGAGPEIVEAALKHVEPLSLVA